MCFDCVKEKIDAVKWRVSDQKLEKIKGLLRPILNVFNQVKIGDVLATFADQL